MESDASAPRISVDYNIDDNADLMYENHSFLNRTRNNEYDENLCSSFMLLFYSVIGFVCLIGLFGTILSFAIMKLRLKGSPIVATYLLQVLTVSDGLFILLWLTHYPLRYLMIYTGQSTTSMYLYVRVVTFPVLYMAQSFTIWSVVTIAFNRYVAVCLPYQAVRLSCLQNIQKIVAAAVLFSIASSLPRYGELVLHYDIDGRLTWNRTALYANKMYKLIYTDLFYYLFSFVIPLLLLFVFNSRILISFRASLTRRQGLGSTRENLIHDDEKITRAMIMVVAVFTLCQTPAKVFYLL